MSDTNSGDNKTGGRGISLRGVGGGRSSVRQSFSHGRSKAVVVETKRKRFLTTRDGAPKTGAAAAAAAATLTAKPKPKPQGAPAERAERAGGIERKDPAKARGERGGTLLCTLTDEQYARQLVALKQAKKDDEIRRKREAEEARLRSEQEARRKIEEQAKAEVEAEERQRREAEEAERSAAEAGSPHVVIVFFVQRTLYFRDSM